MGDLTRVRAELAGEWRRLWQAEVVEQAERVIRAHHRQMVYDELSMVHDELQAAQRHLAEVGQGQDRQAVVTAEEDLCAVQAEASRLLRHHAQENQACEQAEIAFSTSRAQILRRINSLQRLLRRVTGDPMWNV